MYSVHWKAYYIQEVFYHSFDNNLLDPYDAHHWIFSGEKILYNYDTFNPWILTFEHRNHECREYRVLDYKPYFQRYMQQNPMHINN